MKMKMDHSNIFEEFNLKLHEVLECPEHGLVLHAFRDLAEGRRANLLEGNVIEPLSGLGQQQARGDDPGGYYRSAMAKMLSWGIHSFPFHPSSMKPSLWTSMALLDGPKGYNIR